eukprot:CAMPEP_0175057670 /NCGR_PEP_ID=MMETSP0052_2-20121109/11392_1 /TAXON_ID=51329 ORGANISM="Polytomella parva, Strain SAG 63-3" /NCGR_SAMPLE_ID=MMETSP0052_2 /ASSEMBLY_ACC=CAM_ASM_000194 /LENGTH=227 /DNA_ID=CAMNT_0016322907 /DNA_START=532 /DNA_END=1212 /DNA_ORIENTATION=-
MTLFLPLYSPPPPPPPSPPSPSLLPSSRKSGENKGTSLSSFDTPIPSSPSPLSTSQSSKGSEGSRVALDPLHFADGEWHISKSDSRSFDPKDQMMNRGGDRREDERTEREKEGKTTKGGQEGETTKGEKAKETKRSEDEGTEGKVEAKNALAIDDLVASLLSSSNKASSNRSAETKEKATTRTSDTGSTAAIAKVAVTRFGASLSPPALTFTPVTTHPSTANAVGEW